MFWCVRSPYSPFVEGTLLLPEVYCFDGLFRSRYVCLLEKGHDLYSTFAGQEGDEKLS